MFNFAYSQNIKSCMKVDLVDCMDLFCVNGANS
jgi:hypothetical protein